jgi:phage FluMu protein Com
MGVKEFAPTKTRQVGRLNKYPGVILASYHVKEYIEGECSMQIRCQHCHKPFALGKEAVHEALDEISEQSLNHYNLDCPHCRRVNRISPDELKRSAPDWQKKDNEEVQST